MGARSETPLCVDPGEGPGRAAIEAERVELEASMAEPNGLITCAVRDYWQSCRKRSGLPARADIDPVDIPRLLAHVLLVDVRHDPIDFRYRLLGTEIVGRSARDYTGVRLAELPEQRCPSRIWTLYSAVATDRSPGAVQVPYLPLPGQSVEIFAAPLSSDGRRIDMLFGAVEFPPEARSFAREGPF